MLLVILISAAPDGAAPGSRSLGSPFDPATSSVAVATQNSRLAQMVTANEAKPAFAMVGASGLGAAILPTFGSLAFVAVRPLPFAHADVKRDERARIHAHGARAPPAD